MGKNGNFLSILRRNPRKRAVVSRKNDNICKINALFSKQPEKRGGVDENTEILKIR